MTSPEKHRSYRLYLLLAIAVLIPLFVIKQLYFPNNKLMNDNAEFVGRETCIECHQIEQMDFMGSDHDLAMDIANDSTVLGDFNDAELLRANGELHKAYKKEDRFFVLTDSENGEMKEYEVKFVFGHNPLQNYLVEFPGGRLQVLALTWNTRDNEWFYMADSVYQDMNIHHSNWLHWTNQAQNWNSMCAFCHTTGFKKEYNPESDSYNTSWSEIDVSCEACHGPASLHLEWAKLPEYAQRNIPNYGLTTKTSGLTNEELGLMCAQCHSRRGTFSDLEPHNMSAYDFMQIAHPTQPQWHVDGQIHDEDYVFASFAQSKMYQRGVSCADCHNVHSGDRILEGNALCLQCHNASDYDTYKHHRHQPHNGQGKAVTSAYGDIYEVGSGTECINCHMPAQYYMGVDLRNDHSFRVPRPDLSDKLGTPNACVQCHGNETNQWAAKHIKDWHGEPYKHHWGEDIFAAINAEEGADSALIRLIDSAPEVYPNIVRSAALSYLNEDKDSDFVSRYLTSENDMLRSTAVSAISANSEEVVQQLFPLLRDERLSIRAATVLKLASHPLHLIPQQYFEDYKNAVEDFGGIQKYNADFPLGKFNLANYYVMKSRLANNANDSVLLDNEAQKYYLKAYKQDTAMGEFALQLAYRYNKKADYKNSGKFFKLYLSLSPSDANSTYDCGLVLSSLATEEFSKLKLANPTLAQKKTFYDESLSYLEKAFEMEPTNWNINPNNIAQIYIFYGNKQKAETVLKQAVELRPENINDHFNLLQFYAQNGIKDKANKQAKAIVTMFPNNANAQQLKGWTLN